MSDKLYSCIGKGGVYQVIDSPTPAGKSKNYESVIIYKDVNTEMTFWRFKSDFYDRMEEINGKNTEEVIRSKERI